MSSCQHYPFGEADGNRHGGRGPLADSVVKAWAGGAASPMRRLHELNPCLLLPDRGSGCNVPRRRNPGTAARASAPPRPTVRTRAAIRASTFEWKGQGRARFPVAQAQLVAWREARGSAARPVPRACASPAVLRPQCPPHRPGTASRAAERVDGGRVRRPVAGGGRKMAAGRGGGS